MITEKERDDYIIFFVKKVLNLKCVTWKDKSEERRKYFFKELWSGIKTKKRESFNELGSGTSIIAKNKKPFLTLSDVLFSLCKY